ncbi:MAG TPA: thioredoxin domain-containing protein [Gemmatimonadaceae bacterium]|nr:thioredoxin domain-containing protein [Gemmatimonadaceae bacterium]
MFPLAHRLSIAVLLSAAVATVGCAGRGEEEEDPAPDPRLQSADVDRIRGDSAASTWLLIVSDFQCPWCKRWHDDTGPRVQREYVETGRVRVAYLHFPLDDIHRHARPAAEASMCAGAQGKFWAFHDSVFASQEQWAPLADATPFFDGIATSLGLDRAAWAQCLRDDVMLPMIEADVQRARQAGAQSTPTFFIGRRVLAGAQPFDSFKVALDTALAEAARTGR